MQSAMLKDAAAEQFMWNETDGQSGKFITAPANAVGDYYHNCDMNVQV